MSNDHPRDERTSSTRSMSLIFFALSFFLLITSEDSFNSFSNLDIHSACFLQTSMKQNRDERTNRCVPSKQLSNISSTYQSLPSNYGPSKSTLFSANNRVNRIFYFGFSIVNIKHCFSVFRQQQ